MRMFGTKNNILGLCAANNTAVTLALPRDPLLLCLPLPRTGIIVNFASFRANRKIWMWVAILGFPIQARNIFTPMREYK